MIGISLYDGDQIYLGAVDPEKDAIIEAGWTYQPLYAYYVNKIPAPMTVTEIKKRYEKMIQHMEDTEKTFFFAIRRKPHGELSGFLWFDNLEWTHATARLTLVLGGEEMDHHILDEAAHLGLVYAFKELNLFRVCVHVPGFQPDLAKFYEKIGFTREVCRRRALYLNHQYWDVNHYGMLRDEWERGGSL